MLDAWFSDCKGASGYIRAVPLLLFVALIRRPGPGVTRRLQVSLLGLQGYRALAGVAGNLHGATSRRESVVARRRSGRQDNSKLLALLPFRNVDEWSENEPRQ